MSKDRKSLGAAVGGLKKEMMQVANWYKHLKTINHHKWMVMKYCFRVGLYKQGLLHDLSKYSWTEFSVGVKILSGKPKPERCRTGGERVYKRMAAS